MTTRTFFSTWLGRRLIILATILALFALANCGGGGSDSGPDPNKITITGVVDDEGPNSPIPNVNCRFIDIDGKDHDATACKDNGSFQLEVPPDVTGYVLCTPQSLSNLSLSTFSSTINLGAGSTLTNENVTPTTTVVADIIRYVKPSDPTAHKLKLLNDIFTNQDPNLVLVAEMSKHLYQVMLARQVNVEFGGDRDRDDDGDDPMNERPDGGGVGGDAGDGADFSPLPQAQCTFVVGKRLETGEPLYPPALADYWADGLLDRPDLVALADLVNQGLEYTPDEIQEAFRRVFPQGPGRPISTVTDEKGHYFLPIPANVAGYVRCKPQGYEELVLGTYVPGRQEEEVREDEDVNPATTVFAAIIAPQLEGDLADVKENFLEDMDGLETILSGPNLPDGPLTDISLGNDTKPANSDVGLVAFSVTALFNALYKNDHDVDYLAAIADLADNVAVDPENPVDSAFLEAQGIPSDQTQGLAGLVNDSIDTVEGELGTDLATALSTTRVNVTVMAAAEEGGGPIPDAVVEINNNLTCEGCGDATDTSGQATLTLRGIPKEATAIEVVVSSVSGYEPVTEAIEVVAFATVDLDVILSSTTTFNLVVQGGDGDGGGTVISDPAGIDCTIAGSTVSGDYSEPFVDGRQLVLRATPDETSAFVGWSGGCSGSDLTCTLTMDADTTVTALFSQECPDSDYTIDDSEESFGPQGGEGSFNVTAPEDCPWSALSNSDWIEITAGGDGPGRGTVYYRVLANPTTSSREGVITVTEGVTHTVTQEPALLSCTYSISPDEGNFGPAGGTGTITVTADNGCMWSATSNRTWILFTNNSDEGSGNGSVHYRVLANTAISSRNGAITFNGDDDYTHAISQGGDVTNPRVTITDPDEDPAHTATDTADISGTASDDVQLDRVTWSNNRGGSGTCSGDDSWSARGIALFQTRNVITVTAHDAAGNTSEDTITVIYDPEPPTITIREPDDGTGVTSSTLVIRGSADDNVGLSVSWYNANNGRSGTCTGDYEWECNVTLSEGRNDITVTAQDEAGNTDDDTLWVTYEPPDTTMPTVIITFPTDDETYTTSSEYLIFRGTATDNRGVTEMWWERYTGGYVSGECYLTGEDWVTSQIYIIPGVTNEIRIFARDAAGLWNSDRVDVTREP